MSTRPKENTAIIAGKHVGPGHPSFIVAELGVTHEGDIGVAKEMVHAAKQAGVDAVKVECIDADRLVATDYRNVINYSFKTLSGGAVTLNYHELLKKVSLSYKEIEQLAKIANDSGMPFFGTAFDIETVNFLKQIGSCAIKISSGEVDHIPLLQAAAKSGLPVFFDSGRASAVEVFRAAETLVNSGCAVPIIMHNPSGYPAPPVDVCLDVMEIYRHATSLPVGFSCHTRGNTMVHAAVVKGARVIEKPLSRDNTIEEDEHIFSVNMDDLAAYVEEIRAIEAAMSINMKKLMVGDEDEKRRNQFRQSIVAAKNLPAGKLLEAADLSFARPGYGIRPGELANIIGKKLAVDIGAGNVLTYNHLGA